MMRRRAILWALALTMFPVVFVGMILFVVLLVFSGNQAEPRRQQDLCEASWSGPGVPERSLTPEQLDAAATIFAAAKETGVGNRGAAIGIATALQESDLGADPKARFPDSNGDMGLFQMRYYLGWHADGKTVEENKRILADNAYQARVFFLGHDSTKGFHIPGLVDIKGWESMSLTQAAQRVQVSAFPDAYAKHEPLATSLVTRLSGGRAGPVICGPPPGPIGDCPSFNPAIEGGLTSDALRVLRCGKKKWPQLRSFSLLRPGDPLDHGTGRAVDLMIPKWSTTEGIALGTEIAEYFRANAAAYGVKYIIWRKKLWSSAGSDHGWRDCSSSPSDRSKQASCYAGPNPTAAHLDHVHVSVYGNAATNANDSIGSTAVTPIEKGKYQLVKRFSQARDRLNLGLDFTAPVGTSVRAVTEGTVTEISTGQSGYGNLVKIQFDNSTSILYGYLNNIQVSKNQRVTTGTVIGDVDVGYKGSSADSHLRFEVRVGGRAVNPEIWLTQRGAQP